MASEVAMMLGCAVVNALAFSGSNDLFSKMGKIVTRKEKDTTKQGKNYKLQHKHGTKKNRAIRLYKLIN